MLRQSHHSLSSRTKFSSILWYYLRLDLLGSMAHTRRIVYINPVSRTHTQSPTFTTPSPVNIPLQPRQGVFGCDRSFPFRNFIIALNGTALSRMPVVVSTLGSCGNKNIPAAEHQRDMSKGTGLSNIKSSHQTASAFGNQLDPRCGVIPGFLPG